MGKKIYKVNILKLDHRPERDKRITTHCALVSRAFGADEFYYSGIEDYRLHENINKIVKRWGGTFKINYCSSPAAFVREFKRKENGIVIHLTMYGEQIIKIIKNIKIKENILFIVGGPKVPRIYYELADYNVSVTNQPHSEVAALAISLYLLFPDKLDGDTFNGNIKIIPDENKKNVINLK
jgi:tRNA (cytidine56-2'-O)-methyltransferase